MILLLCIPLVIVIILMAWMIIKHENDGPMYYALQVAFLLFLWPIVFAYIVNSDALFSLDWLFELFGS